MPGKADKVRELSKGGWVKMLKRGEGWGVKFAEVINGRPLSYNTMTIAKRLGE